MPQIKGVSPGGMVFHALNRGVGRMKIFSAERDYLAFEKTVEETLRLDPMRILSYCLMLSAWPLPEPRNWVKLVNRPQTEAEVTAIRHCLLRGRPFGGDDWVQDMAKSLGLEPIERC